MEDKDWGRYFATASLPALISQFVLLQIFWFFLVYPLVPSTLQEFVIEFAVGLCLLAVIFAFGSAIVWLSRQTTHVAAFRFVATVLALSVGVIVFGTAYEFRAQLGRNFHYFLFVHR